MKVYMVSLGAWRSWCLFAYGFGLTRAAPQDSAELELP